MLNKNIFNEVPEVVHSAVLNTFDLLEENSVFESNMVTESSKKSKHRRIFRLSRVAVAGVVLLLISGVTVSAMGIYNLYKKRMLEMNEEQLEEYYTVTGVSEVVGLTSRPYTETEKVRYEELNKAYEQNGFFPVSQVTILEDVEDYDGKGVAYDPLSGKFYLPEEELSNEELLEIIDFLHKASYSVISKGKTWCIDSSDWRERMEILSDEEVDEVYFIMYTSTSDVSGAYSRKFYSNEKVRYDELKQQYEEDGIYVTTEVSVIQTPEEYTGEGVAICVKDSIFYFPEQELTDEELLQLIDFQHKASYCMEKIQWEVGMDIRSGYPKRQ